MAKEKTVNIPADLDIEIAKYQLAQIAKGKEKPRIKDIVKDALKKFLENEK